MIILRNREGERTDLMLKPQSMSIVGLCLDILLIKKDCAKKRSGVFQRQLNLAHIRSVRRISALPPSSTQTGAELYPVSVRPASLDNCAASAALPKSGSQVQSKTDSRVVFFSVKYPISQAIKRCLYFKRCARVEIVRLDVT